MGSVCAGAPADPKQGLPVTQKPQNKPMSGKITKNLDMHADDLLPTM